MPLFSIQDNDRPAYVIADNYGEAQEKFLQAIFEENKEYYSNVDELDIPLGISFICPDEDIIIDQKFLKPL